MKVVSGLALLLFAYSADALYRCNRMGAVCFGTCNSDGTCDTCDTDVNREGYDCSIHTDTIDTGGCGSTLTCLNGGTCYVDGAADTCLCTDRWTGNDCSTPVYDLACNTNVDVSLTVNAVDTFGYLFAYPNADVPACADGDGTAAPTLTSIPFTGGDCDSSASVDGTTSIMTFVWRSRDGLTQPTDEFITVRCGSGDTVEQSVEVTEVTLVENTDLVTVEEGSVPTSTDVDMTLVDAADAEIVAAVLLGDPITVKIDLSTTGLQNFEAVRVEECTAYDMADKSGASVNLVTTSCPGTEMTLDADLAVTGTMVTYGFQAFKFDTVDNVFLFCTVKVCADAADCAALDCGTDTGVGFGRKKRDAGEVVNQPLGQQFRVIDPLVEAARTIQEFKDTKACYQTWEMTATVVALAVALLIVLLICIILIVKAILNKRTTKTYREDVSETASTAHFPHLPTIISNKA